MWEQRQPSRELTAASLRSNCRRLGKMDRGTEKRRKMPQVNYTKKYSA